MARSRLTASHMAPVQIPCPEIHDLMQCGVVKANVQIAALAGLHRIDDAGQQRHRSSRASREIDHREASTRRRSVRFTRQRKIASFGLHQVIVAGPRGTRAGAPIRRQVHANDFPIYRRQIFVIESELDRQIAAQIVERGVGGSREVEKDLFAIGLLEVERNRFLVAVERLVEVTVVLAKKMRTDLPADVAALTRVLDLDDFGSEVGEMLRTEWAGAILLDRQDTNAVERQMSVHIGFLATSWRAMMMRCNSFVPSPIARRGASR